MGTLLIANNCTRESGSFMGDQLCALKAAYLFVENEPSVDKVIMSMSPANEMNFLWQKFIDKYNIEIIWDNWNPGDWETRFSAWNEWRKERKIEGRPFDHYRELYLRIHGARRQTLLCGLERGLGRRNIYEYWFYGQEHLPEFCVGSDWYDDSLIYHPQRTSERDVYIAPHCKTQGNVTFTFDYWAQVVHKLIDAGVSVTVGYDGVFCSHLDHHPLFKRYWGNHKQWLEEVCRHKIVACGNTGTGWVAAACGVPLFTMEPPNSQMPDHRYRECGLRNIVEVMDTPDADYCAKRLVEEVQRCVVMTTGCYDIIHAGHIRHLERCRALGTKLIVALNSDSSVRSLKGSTRPINSQDQRKTVLEALRMVDEVRVFDGPNAIPLIKDIKPDILAVGYGYSELDIVGRDVVKEWGGKAIVTYSSDASNEPSTTKTLSRILRSGDVIEICRVGASYSVNPFDKLKLMADEFLKVSALQGDVADLGVFRGGTSLILRRLAPDKELHLFDTWQGTPYDDPLCHHKAGEWKAPLEDCQLLVGKDKNTHYYPGVFPKVVEGFIAPFWLADRKFCFVYVDMDTERATRDAIEFFWPRLTTGGKLFFDDYGWAACAGVKKAVDERFASIEKHVVQSQFACIVEKK